MDSDKENLSYSSVSWHNTAPTSHLSASLPEKLDSHSLAPQPSSLISAFKSNTILRSQDICIDDPPLTADELLLAKTAPELARLFNSLKVRGITDSIEPELLDPLSESLEAHVESFEDVRAHAEGIIEQTDPFIEYLEGIKKRMEDELKPFLDVFGVGLPTEEWHVDAVKALVAEKLRKPLNFVDDKINK